jgi:integrase
MTVSGSIGKGKTSWHYVIELGKDMFGKRKQKRKRGFKTKKEAQKALTESLHAMNTGRYIEPNKMHMSEYLDNWLNNKQIQVKKSTFKKYYWLVNSHIKPYIGNIALSKLSGLNIQQLYRLLATEKHLSNENIRKVHSVLNNALKEAVRLELILKNVASLVDPPKAIKPEVKVWDVDEAQHFLKVTQSNRYHIVYLLALTTGMRQGEILGLRWKDIDFDREMLYVRQTLSHDGFELNPHTKTAAGTRTIALPAQVLQVLQEHKIMQAKEKLKAKEIFENFDLIVCTNLGTPLHPRNLLRNFYLHIEKAKLNKIRFHDLRHTHASLLLKQGVHPKIVSERLGHADTRITMDTYSHLLPNMQRDTAKEFGKMFFGT